MSVFLLLLELIRTALFGALVWYLVRDTRRAPEGQEGPFTGREEGVSEEDITEGIMGLLSYSAERKEEER